MPGRYDQENQWSEQHDREDLRVCKRRRWRDRHRIRPHRRPGLGGRHRRPDRHGQQPRHHVQHGLEFAFRRRWWLNAACDGWRRIESSRCRDGFESVTETAFRRGTRIAHFLAYSGSGSKNLETPGQPVWSGGFSFWRAGRA